MDKYYTYVIHITNRDSVRVEARDPDNNLIGQPSGAFACKGETQTRIQKLHQFALDGELKGHGVKELGEKLFNALFDEGLRHNFFGFYKRVCDEDAFLRIELDVDERQLPYIAALPWEFMRVPFDAGYGEVWLGTAPHLVFSRRRAHWIMPKPIQLKANERLRIAIAVADPRNGDLGPVKFDKVLEALNKLATDHSDLIELLETVNPATTESIDAVLEKKPHIFHFIGHGRLEDEKQRDSGQIALVDDEFDKPIWIGAERFSELFNRHQPGIVVLQACEGARLSASKAFVGLASQVVEQNIPVVVAMQYEVSNFTARQFALEFYRRLSENAPVDKALQEGRRQISLGSIGYAARDFATPVLFMRVQDGYLFQRSVAKVTKEVLSEDKSNSVRDALIVLRELLRDPEVQASVVKYQTVFQVARQQIDILYNYKGLHDQLHELELKCYNYIVQLSKRSQLHEEDWNTLTDYDIDFEDTITEIGDIVNRETFHSDETKNINRLVQAREELNEAIKNQDMQKLKGVRGLLSRVFAHWPFEINIRLGTAARTLQLPELVSVMKSVRDSLSKLDLDPDKVGRFMDGVQGLEILNQSLDARIREHDQWQEVDQDLRRIQGTIGRDIDELQGSWGELKASIGQLCGDSTEEWVKSLKEEGEKLEQAMVDPDSTRTRDHFLRYRRRGMLRFYRVDKNLKILCGNLNRIGEQLPPLLRVIGE
ncbi:MAG: hypothetical protein BA861_11575 [Desulfobacterales bacterium S3730MH5]|nr:MAG: hypothetical protein BA861_11575 [Desulfobacterales bacterium S3730MH5]